ncbi:MAG: ABC transporter ATP-binding protein/permease, partial [Lachnospiraceae bacterium]|nr:ABC transporter ATP-binding protein/permease [Lachnospiraceae bacterium]
MKKRSGFRVMAGLIGMVKPLAGFMVLAILMGLIGHLCATFITVLGGYAVLNVLGYETIYSLRTIFILAVVFAIVRGFLRYAEQYSNHFIAFNLLAMIRDKVFQALRKLCPAKLEGKDKGNLISVITSDIELLEVFYAHTISPIAIAVLFSIVMLLYIGQFHLLLAFIALLAYLSVGVVIPLVISRQSGDTGMRFREKSGELSSFVLDSLRGLSEIQQYGVGKDRLQKMNAQTEALSDEESQLKKVTGRNVAVTNTVILIFDLVMIGAAATLCQSGAIGFDEMLLAVLALMSSFGPSVALANLGSTLQNTFAAGNRVLDILDETPAVEDVTGKWAVAFEGAAAEHVTFSYGESSGTAGKTTHMADSAVSVGTHAAMENRCAIGGMAAAPILSDVSVEIPEHAFIGISGRSGSGKSTLLKLFMRFWETNEGKIQISGRRIDEINTSNLRDMESYVTQETHLFRDSIKNNLRIANLSATDAQIEKACKKAAIHDFIMTLPDGYDTQVGELGDTLSGGERQRLGLARAFLHDAPFMLLDEPTSNLDSLNEAVILKSLHEEREGKTVVLVSHRKSTMK